MYALRRAAAALTGIAILILTLVLVSTASAAADGSFRITYDPPLAEVHAQGNPDSPKTLTTITVQALGADGRPVRDAQIEATLTAPDPPTIVGSDVPRAEGLPLVRTSFGAPDGQQSFSTVLPIRGEYRLDLRASPTPGGSASFAPFSQAASFDVNERAGEARNLILALLALGLFGALSAVVMARPHMRRRAAATGAGGPRTPGRIVRAPGITGAVAVLGFLLAAYVGSLVLDTTNAAKRDRAKAGFEGAGKGLERTARSDRAQLRYRVNRSTEDGISVQTLVSTDGSLLDPRTAEPVPGGEIRIEVLDRETGKPAFVMQEPTAGGRFRWDVDYWDGVEYDTKVAAVPAAGESRFGPVSDTVEMAVQPLAPPLTAKFVGVSYLLLPVLIGMALGVLFARRQWGSGPRSKRVRGTFAKASVA